MVALILVIFSVGLMGANVLPEPIRFDGDAFRTTGYLPPGISLEQAQELLRSSSGLKSGNVHSNLLDKATREGNYLLSSEERELFWVTPTIRDKRDFTYNDDNDLIQILEQNWENSDWVNNLKEILTYGENNMVDYGSYYIWQNNTWQDGNIYTNTYDTEGQLITQVYTYQEGNGFQNFYTYDEHGNLIESLTQVWNVSQVWLDNFRATYTYDENQRQIELLSSYFQDDNWVNSERITYTYDENDHLVEELTQYNEDGQWVNFYRAELFYDENNLHVHSDGFLADGAEWNNNRLMTWTYDENHNNIDYLMEASYDGGNSWEDFIHETRVFQLALSVERDGNSIIPNQAELRQNYPNPFNPSTTIRYGLSENANVSLTIYDVQGNLVQILDSEYRAAGWYETTWNGTKKDGTPVTTGVYLAKLNAGAASQVVKMLFLK